MICTKCDIDASVIDSRQSQEFRRRRYECYECGTRFSTIEVVVKDRAGFGSFMKQLNETKTTAASNIINEMKEVIKKYEMQYM